MENVINFDLLKEYDGTLKEVLKVWQKEKSYSVDDIIQYKGNYLKCTTAGTSGTTTLDFTDIEVGDTITDGTVVWEVVEPPSGKGIDFYTVGESYDIGDIVIYNGSIYQCITAHTATSTFDNTKWEEISKSGIPYYSQDTYYKVDDQVVYNNKIYKCIMAHTSTSTFDSAKWSEINGRSMSNWQASYSYDSGDIVLFDDVIYKANTTHTSSSDFSKDSSNWDIIYANIIDFDPNKFYKDGSIVINDNKLYKCLYDTVLVYNDSDMKIQSSNPATYDFDMGDDYELVEISVHQYDSTAYITHIDYYGSIDGVDYYKIGEMNDSSIGEYDKVAKVNVNSAIRHVRAEVTAQFVVNIGFDNFKFYIETLNLVEISASESSDNKGISIWKANTAYNANDVVIDSNLIWQCATAHTSTTTFDESKWVCISGGEISNGMEIVPLWEGVGNVLNQVLTLNDSYNNYDYILGTMADGAGVAFASNILETISGNGLYIMGVLSSGGVKRAFLQFSSNQATILEATGLDSSKYISKLQGIRKAKPIVSSGMKYETLWSGTEGSTSSEGTSTINLSDNVNKYKSLRLILTCYQGSSVRPYTKDIDVEEYIDFITNGASNYEFGVSHDWYSSSEQYFTLLYGSTNTQLHIGYRHNVLTKVIGISEGVQIPTGVQAARVTLWEGNAYTAGETLTLSDDYSNYDYVIVALEDSAGYVASSVLVDPKTQFSGYCQFYVSTTQHTGTIEFSGNTATIHSAINLSANWSFRKITGIKYIQPDSYSTEEKLIGTWIDGKPLYRKVFTPAGSGENYTFSTGLTSNNYNVCRIYAYIFDSSGDFLSIPFYNGYSRYSIYITPSTGDVKIGSNNATYNIDSVVIEYTKN